MNVSGELTNLRIEAAVEALRSRERFVDWLEQCRDNETVAIKKSPTYTVIAYYLKHLHSQSGFLGACVVDKIIASTQGIQIQFRDGSDCFLRPGVIPLWVMALMEFMESDWDYTADWAPYYPEQVMCAVSMVEISNGI
ncbi:MAG: hypothetical protein WBB28_01925 [Crinalium sp.]